MIYDEKTQKFVPDSEDFSNKLDYEKYSIENLKRRYPDDKYFIEESEDYIWISDTNTYNSVIDIKKTNGNGDVVYSVVCGDDKATTNSKKIVTTLDFMSPGAYQYFLRYMNN